MRGPHSLWGRARSGIRMKQRHGGVADVQQLHEFVAARLGMIMDFSEEDGADARTGIGSSEGDVALGGKLFFAGTVEVPAEGDAGISGPKSEAMRVASEVAPVARE